MELLLYGLDEAGHIALAEKLAPERRVDAHEIATRLLEQHFMVEVWDGPTCMVRLRRREGVRPE